MAAPPTPDVPDIERRVLGAALADEAACAALFAGFDADRFLDVRTGWLARLAQRLYEAGRPVNEDTLTAEGAAPDDLADLGVMATDAETVAHHVDLLNQAHLARSLQRLFRTGLAEADLCAAGDGEPYLVADRIARRVTDAAARAQGAGRDGTHIRFAVAEALAETDRWRRGEVSDFVPTGFYSLDRVVGGYPRGEVTTLAAMTGSGKTALVVQIVRSLAMREASRVRTGMQEAPGVVVVFSAEMTRAQITHRAASAISGVNTRDLRTGRAPEADYDFYDSALRSVGDLEIHIEDEPAPTLSYLHARLQQIRLASASGRIEFVAVDYDEKIDADGDNAEGRLAAVAQGLKVIAKRSGAALLMLSQYNRKAVPTQIPSNDWLRASGKKEQESAMIVHWHHPEYWVEKGHDPAGVPLWEPGAPEAGHLIVSKNRFGPVGRARVLFHRETQRFTDPRDPEAAPVPQPTDSPF
ncbi:MAG: DnaB-like helicase C-terminal domain-containing protein [Bacteroidota bacterium]